MSSFVTSLDLLQQEKLKKSLLQQGFDFLPLPHAKFKASKDGISCALYESGKLVVQGKKSAQWIDFFLEPEILGKVMRSFNSQWHENFETHLGSDETGKGDLFGALCVACVLVEQKHLEELHKIGVQDSKNIGDSRIREMAHVIWKSCPCQVQILTPALYNKLWAKFKNLNRLLAWCHANVIYELMQSQSKLTSSPKVAWALVDQFSENSGIQKRVQQMGLSLEIKERTRAESDSAVAAASVLARACFLKNLDELGKAVGFKLPKGSGAPAKEALAKILRQDPFIDLGKIAKLHFKTVGEVKKELGLS